MSNVDKYLQHSQQIFEHSEITWKIFHIVFREELLEGERPTKQNKKQQVTKGIFGAPWHLLFPMKFMRKKKENIQRQRANPKYKDDESKGQLA